MKNDYGLRMRISREACGLTQAAACKLLGVSKSSLSTYERSVREPNYKTLERMCRLYKTTTDFLILNKEHPIYIDDLSESKQKMINDLINSLRKEELKK